MEEIALTLLGYPLSILASITYDQFKNIKDKIGDLAPMEKLYIKCFYKAIDRHNKSYDEYSSKILRKLKAQVKSDEPNFLRILSQDGNISITSLDTKEFKNIVSKKICKIYNLEIDNAPELVPQIIEDCFSFYTSSFYDLMNEKEGIQAILVECLKLNNILDLLKNINQQIVTKDEFDNLRKIIYTYYINNNNEYRKTLQDYDSYIKNKFKYLELRGFSPKVSGKEVQMELEDIFVPLAINRQQRIVPNIQDESNNAENVSLNSFEILNHRTLVILGDPGSGKSTLLKYLATRIVVLRESEHLLKNITPVFFRLSDYSDFYNKEKKSIYEYITAHLDNQYQHIYKKSLEYSNMLILMDGLDEITETPLRLRVTEQVMDLIARYPNNRYIVTSRIVGYQESKLGGAFVHYKLLPFTKKEITLFSNQWYKSIAHHTDKNFNNAKQQAENLYKSIFRNPSVLKLASNPLLMTIISMIHYQGKKLPSKRVELYEISTETFLEHWVQLRLTDEKQLKDKAEIIELLAPIAFEIHKTKSNALIEENEFRNEFLKYFQIIHTNTEPSEAKKTCNDFISFLRQQTGFFYEKGVDDEGNRFFGFMHLTFEEYLAAIELVSRWNERELNIADYIFQPRWTEIIRLAASQIRLSFKGKAGRTQTSNFIQDILDVNDDFKDAHRPLQIACLIISDDVSINDELQNEIFKRIIDLLSITKYSSLVNSFSELFTELLQSEKHDYFVNALKKHLSTENKILLKNISVILINNSHFPFIRNLLKETSDRNEIILYGLLNSDIDNPIRKEEFFLTLEENFIIQYNFEKNPKHENNLLLDLCIRSVLKLNFWNVDAVKKYQINVLTGFINRIKNPLLLDYIVKTFINNLLMGGIRRNNSGIHLVKNVTKQFTHPYLKNLLTLKNISIIRSIGRMQINRWCGYHLTEAHGAFLQSGKKVKKFQWSLDFKKLIIEDVPEDIEHYLKLLKDKYSTSDYDIILSHIYYIIGPSETKNNVKVFLDSYEQNFLFNFFNWENFPFYQISKEPQRFSEILIKKAKHYLTRNNLYNKSLNTNIEFPLFDEIKVLPPIKLLFHIKFSQPYDDNIIKESLDYYNNCNNDMKEGTFDIIYNVLNISKRIDADSSIIFEL